MYHAFQHVSHFGRRKDTRFTTRLDTLDIDR